VSFTVSSTSLRRGGGALEIGKEGGGHLRFNGGLTWNSPGFELNDVGFMRVADQITQWATVGWRVSEPFSIFRSFNANLNQSRGWDFGGTNLSSFGGGNVDFQLRNHWGFATGLFRDNERTSNQALRGGPSLAFPGGVGNWFNLRSGQSPGAPIQLRRL